MRTSATLLLALVLVPSLSAAQATLPRNDIALSVGWAGSEHEFRDYDRWRGSLALSLSAGHYWTDHLKTDIEATWHSATRTESYGDLVIGGLPTFATSTYQVRDARLAIGQSFQFGRNEWVHPYLGAGVDIIRRQTELDRAAQSGPVYAVPSRPPLNVPIPALHRDETLVLVRPYVKGGLKMYATERVFVTSELKLGFAPDLDHALWKVALGFDF